MDSKDPMKNIWEFFVKWLTALKGPVPQRAFDMIDGPIPGHQTLTAEILSDILKEFSGDATEQYTFDDIILDGEEFDLSKADSVVRSHPDGAYYASLWVPLRGSRHEFVLGFYLVPCGNDYFRVLLNDEPLVM
jgi:hypothetical protein